MLTLIDVGADMWGGGVWWQRVAALVDCSALLLSFLLERTATLAVDGRRLSFTETFSVHTTREHSSIRATAVGKATRMRRA